MNSTAKLLVTSLASIVAIATSTINVKAEQKQSDIPQISASPQFLENIQVYGQSAQPNQLHKGYLVFQKHDDKVVGAYYLPHSEFSCFFGDLNDKTLDVNLLPFPGDETHKTQISLASLHRLEKASQNDKRILAVCHQEQSS